MYVFELACPCAARGAHMECKQVAALALQSVQTHFSRRGHRALTRADLSLFPVSLRGGQPIYYILKTQSSREKPWLLEAGIDLWQLSIIPNNHGDRPTIRVVLNKLSLLLLHPPTCLNNISRERGSGRIAKRDGDNTLLESTKKRVTYVCTINFLA